MDKLVGWDKVVNFMKCVKFNGGVIGSFKTIVRMDDLKWGKFMGEDEMGNKYYENNFYFYGRNRWVVYADRVGLNYDASQVAAEWYGWLHYKTDYLPHEDPGRPKYKWMAKFTPNYTGTNQAYMPYSTTKPKIEPWKPPTSSQ